MSGLIADAKTLIDKARVETQNHWFTYNETMTVESVTQAVSNLALQFGEEDADPGAMASTSRPFGVALLFGGADEKGPQLFHMDPSGTFVQCDARAIGSASEGAQSSLQEVYHKVRLKCCMLTGFRLPFSKMKPVGTSRLSGGMSSEVLLDRALFGATQQHGLSPTASTGHRR
ncbi:hypothetical protein AB205_0169070 [Aquarana catesbeiana]|uniref:Proteasome subunit alpha type-5 n=1 Tax=Aquarana catesbeiana TaxID=8400 RepID=A0A2G9S1K3_AQUCT|nr:hypothetical protein AB205_0169070 [Aquarana catesbeiana]